MAIIPLPSSIPWKWIGVGFCALAVVAAIYFSIMAYGDARYDAGKADERRVWQEEVERIRDERDAAMLVAQENDAAIAAAGEAAIEKARKELDDVVEGIPDKELSARQRARACYELQRQGRRCPA